MLSINSLNKKYKSNHCDLSIIIPSKDFSNSLNDSLESVLNQTILPKEIIIVDSSDNDNNQTLIKNKFDLSFIKFFKVKNLYPGEARNFGVNKSISKYLGFLDSKTKPKPNWINDYLLMFKKNNYDIIFGTTKYVSKNIKEKIFIASSYGFNLVETTPGSIMKKSIFLENNYFIERVRTADDLEWRNNLKNKNYLTYTPDMVYLTYSDVSKSLLKNISRYFIYSFHTARVDVQTKTKTLYFCLFLICTAIIIPKWNWLLPDWDQSPLYIPNITKIYFLTLISFFFIYIIFKNFIFKNLSSRLINITFQLIFFILSFYLIYRFNIIIANSLEDLINFFPHTMQFFLLSLIIMSLFIRGIFLPISRGVNLSFLFPVNFLYIMFYGLLIDISKTPGYLLGSFFQIFNFTKNNNKPLIYNIIFLSKYSEISASVRYRFLIYKKHLEINGYNVTSSYMFSDKVYNAKIFNNKILFFNIIYSYFKRLFTLIFLKKNTLAIIHLELTPFLFSIGERILFLKKTPFIIDLDDAIYFRNEKFQKNFNYILNFNKSFNFSLKNCNKIFAGNKDIFNFVEKYNHNSTILPTILDCKKINESIGVNKNKQFTIVWIGSPSTAIYLNDIIPYLQNIYKANNFKLRLIGSGDIEIKNIDYEIFKWDEKTETKLIAECHIGIMPLADTIWSRSKCGFKLLQYMACGIPVIASPIGVNKIIVKDDYNGFLCSNENEWTTKINYLLNNKEYIAHMGENAKNFIFEYYDLDVWKNKFIEEINKI